MTEMTRRELYDKVWAKPMSQLADEFGISDVGLKKICDRHRVPVPGRGYWAKIAAGQSVKKAHFREVGDAKLNRISIRGGHVQNMPEPVREVCIQARRSEVKPENKVNVGSAVAATDPDVIRTIKHLKRTRIDNRELKSVAAPNLFQVTVSEASLARVEAVLEALVVAAKERGYRIETGEEALQIRVNGEPIRIRLEEEIEKSPHEPTASEQAAMEKWERYQERRFSSQHFLPYRSRPVIPEVDHIPSGKLRLHIEERVWPHQGLRKSFGDAKTQRLESLLNAILESLAIWSAALKEERRRCEEQRLRWEEEARRRREAERRNALERKRVEALQGSLESLEKHQQITDFIAAVEAHLESASPEEIDATQDWLAWARGYAARVHPLAGGAPKLLKEEDFQSWELGGIS